MRGLHSINLWNPWISYSFNKQHQSSNHSRQLCKHDSHCFTCYRWLVKCRQLVHTNFKRWSRKGKLPWLITLNEQFRQLRLILNNYNLQKVKTLGQQDDSQGKSTCWASLVIRIWYLEFKMKRKSVPESCLLSFMEGWMDPRQVFAQPTAILTHMQTSHIDI